MRRLLIPLLLGAAVAGGCARSAPQSSIGEPSLVLSDALVERGRYIVHGPGHCGACHTPLGPETPITDASIPALSGGYAFRLPGGQIAAPNLTPDPETGIGRRSDAELFRILRYGVRHDGRAAIPIMQYQQLSDEDTWAVIAYLRSTHPVRNPIPGPSFILPVRLAMGLVVRPVGPQSPPPPRGPLEEISLERGAYLVTAVAQCGACHTDRGPTGGFRGPPLAGGLRMRSDVDPKRVFVTPNLTPHPETGALVQLTEDAFVARFELGTGPAGSHMPWAWYARISETDLRSVYRYLNSLPPAARPR